jgi:hypothetical protein
VSSDAKHVEIGLTDKSDAARWLIAELARSGVGAGLVLIAGDEFGSLGGLPGSDSLMLVPEAQRSTAVSVGAEPTGAPADVLRRRRDARSPRIAHEAYSWESSPQPDDHAEI